MSPLCRGTSLWVAILPGETGLLLSVTKELAARAIPLFYLVMSYARVNEPGEEYRINNEAAPFIVILFRGNRFDYIVK